MVPAGQPLLGTSEMVDGGVVGGVGVVGGLLGGWVTGAPGEEMSVSEQPTSATAATPAINAARRVVLNFIISPLDWLSGFGSKPS